MTEFLDIYSLIFLVLAIAILFRLRSVLGRRTGSERRRYDPFSGGENEDAPEGPESNDNVITLPRGERDDDETSPENADEEKLKKIAPEGSSLNAALRAILSVDQSFDPNGFVTGSKAAYEMIVTAFAEGDRKTLKPLLSDDVYDGFISAIDERESRGEIVDSTFVGIGKAELVEAALKDRMAHVTVRFHSELISATRDKSGNVVDGDPNKVVDVVDIWTFARDVSSGNPNWKLIATESG